MLPVEFFIAFRYVLSQRKVRYSHIISFISITGITIGVAALLIVLSVFNGFNAVVTSVMLGFDPHIRIEKPQGFTHTEITEFENIINQQKHIKGISAYVVGKGMLVSQKHNKVVYIRGVNERQVETVSGIKQKIIAGTFDLYDSAAAGGMVIGLSLADKLGCVVGDDIDVITANNYQDVIAGRNFQPQAKTYRVSGIFESNNKEYDQLYAYIDVKSAQLLFENNNKYSGLDLRLDNHDYAHDVKTNLSQLLKDYGTISTWNDLHKELYFVMMLERWTGYIILSLIIVVACFNLMGSIAMGIVDKRRDIGVFQTLGMTTKRISNVFFIEGLIIGTVGTILGIVLGLSILLIHEKYKLVTLDPTVYIIPAIPIDIQMFDFFSVGIMAIILSLLAGYIPARRIAKFNIIDSIRWE